MSVMSVRTIPEVGEVVIGDGEKLELREVADTVEVLQIVAVYLERGQLWRGGGWRVVWRGGWRGAGGRAFRAAECGTQWRVGRTGVNMSCL